MDIRPAQFADAIELNEHLRQVEVDEVQAATGRAPLGVIFESIASSAEVWTVRFDGELACIWGVVTCRESSFLYSRGIVWMLTTGAVERRRKAFWKVCLDVLPWLLSRWDELTNAIDARHAQALRWGERLGFRFGPATPFGVFKMPFHLFRVTKGDLHV